MICAACSSQEHDIASKSEHQFDSDFEPIADFGGMHVVSSSRDTDSIDHNQDSNFSTLIVNNHNSDQCQNAASD